MQVLGNLWIYRRLLRLKLRQLYKTNNYAESGVSQCWVMEGKCQLVRQFTVDVKSCNDPKIYEIHRTTFFKCFESISVSQNLNPASSEKDAYRDRIEEQTS